MDEQEVTASQQTLTDEQVHEIRNTLSRVAYVLDSHDYDRMGEVFSDDVHFENPGRLVADGLPALVDAFKGVTNPGLSHHVTNVIVAPVDAVSATCISKALTLREPGVLAAAEYSDTVRKDLNGWRITSRVITPLG